MFSERSTSQETPFLNGNFYINADNQYLFTQNWTSNSERRPRAIVFISHGISEHCLTYEETVARPLNKAGFLVVAHDHIGHGQSEGTPVMVKSFQCYVRDVIDHIENVVNVYTRNIPVFILGHSMGGIIAILSVIERPDLIKGIILNGSVVEIFSKPDSTLTRLIVSLLATVFPSAPMVNLALELHSRDPKVVERLRSDPLRFQGKVKAQTALQYMEAVDLVESKMRELTAPIFIAQGTDDKLAPPKGSRHIFETVGSTDKNLMMFEGCYHQLHREPNGNKERFINSVVDWISERI